MAKPKPPGGRLRRRSRLRKKYRKYVDKLLADIPSTNDLPDYSWSSFSISDSVDFQPIDCDNIEPETITKAMKDVAEKVEQTCMNLLGVLNQSHGTTTATHGMQCAAQSIIVSRQTEH